MPDLAPNPNKRELFELTNLLDSVEARGKAKNSTQLFRNSMDRLIGSQEHI